MPALSYHGNVDDTAVALLRRRGFQVWCDEQRSSCFAERDGWDFIAFDPVQLLGLIAVFEATAPAEYREYWWRDVTAAGMTVALPHRPERAYQSVVERRLTTPGASARPPNTLAQAELDLQRLVTEVVVPLQTRSTLPRDGIRRLVEAVEQAAEAARGCEALPRSLLHEIHVLARVLRAESPYRDTETLVWAADRIDLVFSLLLAGETLADRKPGAPRFR